MLSLVYPRSSSSRSRESEIIRCLRTVEQIITDRKQFNNRIARYLDSHTGAEGLLFIATHFYKLGTESQRNLIFLSFTKKLEQIRENVEEHAKVCRGDVRNFNSLLTCFEHPDLDQRLMALYVRCQVMLHLINESDEHFISEKAYFSQIFKLIAPLLDRELFSFCITNFTTTYTPPTGYRHVIKLENLEPIIQKGLDVVEKLKIKHKKDYVILNGLLQSFSNIIYQNKQITDNDLLRAVFDAFSISKFVRKYESLLQQVTVEDISSTLESIKLSETTLGILPTEILNATHTDTETEITPLVEESSEQTIFHELKEITEQLEGSPSTSLTLQANEIVEDVIDSSLLTPSYEQFRGKSKVKVLEVSTSKTPEQLRVEYYRDKLARFRDLMFLIFRPNTPHMEITWKEVKRLFSAMNAKMQNAEGSRKTIVFNEHEIDESWAEVLEPIEFSQRGIHKSHKPNQSSKKLASIYVEIIQEAITRFGLEPAKLWPECLENMTSKKKKATIK